MAQVVMRTQLSTNIPIRVFNHGVAPVVLQLVKVLREVDFQPLGATAVLEPINLAPFLSPVTCRSCMLRAVLVCQRMTVGGGLAHLLQTCSDVFSMGPTDLSHTSFVQPDILNTPCPSAKQSPWKLAREHQMRYFQLIDTCHQRRSQLKHTFTTTKTLLPVTPLFDTLPPPLIGKTSSVSCTMFASYSLTDSRGCHARCQAANQQQLGLQCLAQMPA